MGVRDGRNACVEAVSRRHDAHIGGAASTMIATFVAASGEHRVHRVEVVVGDHEGLRRDRRGTPADPGIASVATPEPASARSPSECP